MGMETLRTLVAEYGSQKALAEAIGVTQSAISQWLRGETSIGLERAKKIEQLTGGRVKAVDLLGLNG